MSQNLIEKLQEVWGDVWQDRNVRRITRNWNRMKKTDGYKVAAATAKDVVSGVKHTGEWLLRHGKYFLIGGASLISGQTSASPSPISGAQPSDSSTADTHKEWRISSTMKHLQDGHSEEQIQQMCCKLLENDSIYNKVCAEKSEQVGTEMLRIAQEVQEKIGGNRGRIRSQVLRSRWGKDIPVGLHCLRSALEVTTEAAENMGAPEFIDTFIQKIRKTNPNGYYGLKGTFAKHRNYKTATRNHNLTQIIAEETKDNPHDILLIAHKSSGNHTGSGYHMVLCFNDTIVSFNNEKIENKDAYFSKVSKYGELINISRTVREDGRSEIVQNITKQVMEDIKDGDGKIVQDLLAMYMGDKDIPLQDRLLAGGIAHEYMPLVAELPSAERNLEHLRKVRAKMSPQIEITANTQAPAPQRNIRRNEYSKQYAANIRQRNSGGKSSS